MQRPEHIAAVIPETEIDDGGYARVDGVLVFDGMTGLTDAGRAMLAQRDSAPAEKPAKGKSKKAVPADPVDEDPVVADLSLPEDFE